MKQHCSIGLMIFGLMTLAPVQVYANVLPTDYALNSSYEIDYGDLNMVLKGSVLDMGPSTHKPPKRRSALITGSRLKIGNTKITRQEGNRVMLHGFEEGEIAYLQKMRDELLSVPGDMSLSLLTRNDQLAFWLNLHNVIVLTEISEQYPVTYLQPFFDLNEPDAFINQRKFEIAGALVSLADIQNHVLANWNDPVVIYGFYMGAVGTPNIQTSAYAGETVYDQLHENAVDFINSMRGTQIWQRQKLNVSSYYQRMESVFPDLETSLLKHIQQYASEDLKRRLITVSKVSATIRDWNIADLHNGNLSRPGGNLVRIAVDAEGVPIKSTSYPEHVLQLLRDRAINNSRRQGKVWVEEIEKKEEDRN